MYYRYKSKKRSGQKFKFIGIVIAVICVIYPIYKFGSHLQFWKYSYNKISDKINQIDKLENNDQKKEALLKIIGQCENYQESHEFSSDGYYLQARASFMVGELVAGYDFTSFIVDEGKLSQSGEGRSHFQHAIQNISKGLCLDQRSRPNDDILVILAKSYFYIDFYNSEEVRRVLDMVRNPAILSRIDDRRFYGLVKIMGGDPEGGVRFLIDTADIQRDPTGRLFLASAYFLAKQYTNAIVEYKNIVDTAPSSAYLIKAKMGLGRVYCTQSLPNEALAQFVEVLKSDPQNIPAKIWSARSFLLAGDKASAKKYLNEIIAKNPGNVEAAGMLKGL